MFGGGLLLGGNFKVIFGRAEWQWCSATRMYVFPVRYLLEERRTSRKNLIELAGRRTFQMHVDFQPAVRRSSTRILTAVCTSRFALRQASFRYCTFVSLDKWQSFIWQPVKETKEMTNSVTFQIFFINRKIFSYPFTFFKLIFLIVFLLPLQGMDFVQTGRVPVPCTFLGALRKTIWISLQKFIWGWPISTFERQLCLWCTLCIRYLFSAGLSSLFPLLICQSATMLTLNGSSSPLC